VLERSARAHEPGSLQRWSTWPALPSAARNVVTHLTVCDQPSDSIRNTPVSLSLLLLRRQQATPDSVIPWCPREEDRICLRIALLRHPVPSDPVHRRATPTPSQSYLVQPSGSPRAVIMSVEIDPLELGFRSTSSGLQSASSRAPCLTDQGPSTRSSSSSSESRTPTPRLLPSRYPIWRVGDVLFADRCRSKRPPLSSMCTLAVPPSPRRSPMLTDRPGTVSAQTLAVLSPVRKLACLVSSHRLSLDSPFTPANWRSPLASDEAGTSSRC
jgi:hypothetical protein